jgi:hypothetical protein
MTELCGCALWDWEIEDRHFFSVFSSEVPGSLLNLLLSFSFLCSVSSSYMWFLSAQPDSKTMA